MRHLTKICARTVIPAGDYPRSSKQICPAASEFGLSFRISEGGLRGGSIFSPSAQVIGKYVKILMKWCPRQGSNQDYIPNKIKWLRIHQLQRL